MEDIIKYLIILLLLAYVVVIALCPSIKNPEFTLFVHENPWVLVGLVILSYYVIIEYDLKIGLLILICVIAVYFDIILIIKGKRNKDNDGTSIVDVHSNDTYWKQVFIS